MARTPTPHLSASADSKEVTGEFFVSADSKGVISPLFPADPRGACKGNNLLDSSTVLEYL